MHFMLPAEVAVPPIDSWLTLVVFLLFGGGAVKLFDAYKKWRDEARSARGQTLDDADAERRHRIEWLEYGVRAYRIAKQHGATDEELGEMPPDRPSYRIRSEDKE